MQRATRKITWSTGVSGDTTAGDMDQASITGQATNIEAMAGLSYQYVWTGSSPLGALGWQVSNSYDASPNAATGTWTDLSTSLISNYSDLNPAGSAGNSAVDLSGLKYKWIRPKYTKTSGTGSLQCWVHCKAAGR
jgi:hypothetical protein